MVTPSTLVDKIETTTQFRVSFEWIQLLNKRLTLQSHSLIVSPWVKRLRWQDHICVTIKVIRKKNEIFSSEIVYRVPKIDFRKEQCCVRDERHRVRIKKAILFYLRVIVFDFRCLAALLRSISRNSRRLLLSHAQLQMLTRNRRRKFRCGTERSQVWLEFSFSTWCFQQLLCLVLRLNDRPCYLDSLKFFAAHSKKKGKKKLLLHDARLCGLKLAFLVAISDKMMRW